MTIVNAMNAEINFQDAVSYDAITQSSTDPYVDGKFCSDGNIDDINDGTNAPIIVATSRDLDFKIVTRRIG